jgi:arylformamidase
VTRDPFRNRDFIANFDDLVEEYKTRSVATRSSLPMRAGVSYGEGRNETMDFFFPKNPSGKIPVHLFIHGGYWRMFSKEDFSFIADTIAAAGAIAAIMDYDLMPAVRLGSIVAQVKKAVRWLAANIENHGGDAQRFSVSGHSAGAHLATFTFSREALSLRPASALLLSGVYDLKPLQSSFLQPLIALTDEEVARYSPLSQHHVPGPHVVVAYGGRETDPFRNQGADFARHLQRQGLSASRRELPDADHMTAVRDLGVPGTAAGSLLADIIRSS